jgi:hypothetical protein
MNANTSKRGRWFRRRQYVIDRDVQVGVATHILAGLGMVALIYAAGLYLFLGEDAVSTMGLSAMRQFLLMANGLYYLCAAVVLAGLSLLLTHRFAGPAYVLSRAIRGMLEGDYGRRLALRKRDYMKPVAAALADLRSRWVAHERRLQGRLEDIRRHLEIGAVEEAARVVAQVLEDRLVRPETLAPAGRAEAEVAARPARAPVAV